MNKAFDKTLQRLTGATKLSKVSEEELARLIEEHPYFAPAQLLLAAKLKQGRKDFAYTTQLQKASLYSSNPFWLQYQLDNVAQEEIAEPDTTTELPVIQHTEAYTAPVAEEPVHTYYTPQPESFTTEQHEQPAVEEHTHEEAVPEYTTMHTISQDDVIILPHLDALEENPVYEAYVTPEVLPEEMPESKPEIHEAGEKPTIEEHHTAPTEETSWKPVTEQFMNVFDSGTFSIPTLERINDLHNSAFIEKEQGEEKPEETFVPSFSSSVVTEPDTIHEQSIAAPQAIVNEETPEAEVPVQQEPVSEHKEPEFTNVVMLSEESYSDHHQQEIPTGTAETPAPEVTPEQIQPVTGTLEQTPEQSREASNDFIAAQKISSVLGNQLKDFHKPIAGGEKFEFEAEPSHLVDYFASQGIKIDLTKQPQDKLTVHLRSFTDWLRQMRKVEAASKEEPMDLELENAVKSIARTSVESREIVTETMADVFIKQGKKDKAIQLYIKLSFLDPEKSTYFAHKIQQLKGI
jgi:hypothetical protein